MITGVFSDYEARVSLLVLGPNGEEQGVAAVIDTGFSGFLSLPAAVVEALGLPWLGRGQALVGDGSHQAFDLYRATVVWGDEPRPVQVASTETEPLLGVSMLYGHDLRIQFIEDGAVAIEELEYM
ncbi:MAG TPA: clan AA aspartic protease [Thermoanaerobaculia bacterium]|jgi:clan AA aspartic protease